MQTFLAVLSFHVKKKSFHKVPLWRSVFKLITWKLKYDIFNNNVMRSISRLLWRVVMPRTLHWWLKKPLQCQSPSGTHRGNSTGWANLCIIPLRETWLLLSGWQELSNRVRRKEVNRRTGKVIWGGLREGLRHYLKRYLGKEIK